MEWNHSLINIESVPIIYFAIFWEGKNQLPKICRIDFQQLVLTCPEYKLVH